jgi:hypothetical protein
VEYQKAQSFFDVLITLPLTPLNVHKLQLMLYLDKEYYYVLTKNEGPKNRAKIYEENIGQRHVVYIFYPNGTVQIAVASSNTPFKIETDEDESILFSFLGQVRDRLIYYVKDIRERQVPLITEWILKACDVNKDIDISDNCQLVLPDIQIKHVDRVFRFYVKTLQGRAVYRAEESLTLNNQILPEALYNIRPSSKALENKVEELSKTIQQLMNQMNGSIPKCSRNYTDKTE